MSSYELAARLGVSQTRVIQFQNSEVAGSIRLVTLRRVAEALECRVLYVLVPNEPLEHVVLRQARKQAVAQLSITDPDLLYDREDLASLRQLEELEELTLYLVDRQALWR
jgi:predicted DNA-binding mobile mystery protein A